MLGSSAFVAHSVFGDVLPNTFYVKQQGFYKGFIGILHMNTLASTLSFMLMLSPLIVVTLLSIRGTSLAIVSSYALPLLFALLWLIGVVQIMGEHLRFYVPFIPLVLISSLLALRHADLNQEELRKSLVRGMPLVLAFLYLFAFPQSTQTFFERVIAAQELRDVQADPTPTNCVGNYTVNGCDAWQATLAIDSLCNEVPSIHTLACSEYGYLAAFHPQLRIVDMVGLHDREMAHQGFNSAHILSQKPQVIWMPHSDYTWLRAELMRDSVFVHEYSYYKGAFCFGVAIRNDDKLIRPKLEEHLQRWYGSGASK